MTFPRWLITIAGVALGVLAVVAGGADDSPGLQGIGLVIVAAAVVFGVRSARRPPW
ncbi:MAG: hypothetical protein Q8M03_00175 [Legionella sp.]|nr:hypothetical protein [Legionella sp.]